LLGQNNENRTGEKMKNTNCVYRLGSVIKTQSIEALVVGYDFIEEHNHMVLAYKVVPYPIGYAGSIKLAKRETCTLIHNGFVNDMSDRVVHMMETCDEIARCVSAKEMKRYLDALFLGKQLRIEEKIE
jgi:hypothetical protein